MNKLVLKTATGIATIGLLVSVVAPSAFAATIDISGNGKKSTNTVTVVSANKNVLKQKSNTVALTFVNSEAKTGKNKANHNMGDGGVSITSGAATSTVTTTVTGGSNEAVDPGCGCPQDPMDITISGNNKKSTNTVTVVSENKNIVKQSSNTVAITAVNSVASTGGNTANGNMGGAVDITTGDADSSVTTEVTGGGNTLL